MYIKSIVVSLPCKQKQIDMKNLIDTLRTAQQVEAENGFVNGNLWNDLEDMIYKINNPEAETEIGEVYGSKTMKEILKNK